MPAALVTTQSQTSTPTPAQPAVSRRRLVIVLGLLSAFGPLCIDMYLPGLPELARNLDTTATAAQLTLTGCLLGLAVGQVVAGSMSDRLGRRGPLIVGVVLFTVSSLLCAVTPSIWLLVLLRFVQGAAGGAGIVIARAVVRDMYEGDDAARTFALLMLVTGTMPILAPLIGGQLLTFTSWRGTFVVLAGAGLLLLLLAVFALPETLPAHRRFDGGLREVMSTYRLLLADRFFLGCALTGGFVAAAMFAYISGSPFVLQDIFGVSPQVFALIFGANAAGLVMAGQLSGLLVGRVRLLRLLQVGVAMSLLGAAVLLVAAVAGLGLMVVLPALFLVVSAVGFVMPNAAALALTKYGDAAGSASAVLGVTLFALGAAVAPLVGVAGPDTIVPMAVVVAVSAVAALAALVWGVQRRRSPAEVLAA